MVQSFCREHVFFLSQVRSRFLQGILLEPGDRDAYMGGYPAGAERAEDAEAQFEAQGSWWLFQWVTESWHLPTSTNHGFG